RLLAGLPPHARIVTLRGEVFRGDGLIIAGRPAADSALSRPRQKRELAESLSVLSRQIESLNEEISSLSTEIAQAEHDFNQAEESQRAARLRLDEAWREERQAELESEAQLRQLQ